MGRCPALVLAQGGEEAGGAGAHHHRRDLRGRHGGRRRVCRGRLDPADLPAAAAAERGGLLFQRDLHGVDQADLLPGVHAAAEYAQGEQILLPHPEETGGLGGQRIHPRPGGKLDGINS